MMTIPMWIYSIIHLLPLLALVKRRLNDKITAFNNLSIRGTVILKPVDFSNPTTLKEIGERAISECEKLQLLFFVRFLYVQFRHILPSST